MARGEDGHEHDFGTDGKVCSVCGVPWADAVRGFYSNVAPLNSRRKSDDGSWLASPDDQMSQGSFI